VHPHTYHASGCSLPVTAPVIYSSLTSTLPSMHARLMMVLATVRFHSRAYHGREAWSPELQRLSPLQATPGKSGMAPDTTVPQPYIKRRNRWATSPAATLPTPALLAHEGVGEKTDVLCSDDGHTMFQSPARDFVSSAYVLISRRVRRLCTGIWEQRGRHICTGID
jgi:hypothetical protein